MRKLIASVCLLAIAAALAGCGLQDPASTEFDAPPQQTTTTPARQQPAQPARPLVVVDRSIRSAPPVALVNAAEAFFASYTAIVYGKGGTLRSASRSVERQLAAQPPLDALRSLTPTIARLYIASVDGARAQVEATVTDARKDGEPQALPATFRRTTAGWVAVAVADGES